MKIETRNFAPHTVRMGWTEGKNRIALIVHFGLHNIQGNRSPHFSITADGYENGKESFGGCCHDIIAEKLPDLADMIALHLSDMDGAPMHADGNGWYWLAGIVDGLGERYHGGSGDYGKGPKECARIFANHARISEPEAIRLAGRINKQFKRDPAKARKEFSAWIDQQRPRWKKEANAVIAKYGLGIYGHDYKTPEEVAAIIA